MIGDWVSIEEPDRYHGYFGEVEIINSVTGYITVSIESHGYHDVFCDDLQPISLTPEIMEKNGFIPNKFNINDVFGTRFDLGNYYNLTFFNSNRGGSLTKYYTSQYGFYITTMQYVHELQHALRLCGIEKKLSI